MVLALVSRIDPKFLFNFLSNLLIKILNYSSIKFDIFVISFVT